MYENLSQVSREGLAPIRESAEALIEVIGKLRPRQTGEFYDWQGKYVAW